MSAHKQSVRCDSCEAVFECGAGLSIDAECISEGWRVWLENPVSMVLESRHKCPRCIGHFPEEVVEAVQSAMEFNVQHHMNSRLEREIEISAVWRIYEAEDVDRVSRAMKLRALRPR